MSRVKNPISTSQLKPQPQPQQSHPDPDAENLDNKRPEIDYEGETAENTTEIQQRPMVEIGENEMAMIEMESGDTRELQFANLSKSLETYAKRQHQINEANAQWNYYNFILSFQN